MVDIKFRALRRNLYSKNERERERERWFRVRVWRAQTLIDKPKGRLRASSFREQHWFAAATLDAEFRALRGKL
jgi:hypothetical protein